jgi:hypothetical protein
MEIITIVASFQLLGNMQPSAGSVKQQSIASDRDKKA